MQLTSAPRWVVCCSRPPECSFRWRRVDLLYIATLAYNFNPHQRVSNESPTNLNSVANIPFMRGRVVEPSDEDNGDNSSSLLRTNMHLWHLLAQFNRVLMRTPPSQQFHACAQTRVSSSYSRTSRTSRTSPSMGMDTILQITASGKHFYPISSLVAQPHHPYHSKKSW